jgi:hypothetical protein
MQTMHHFTYSTPELIRAVLELREYAIRQKYIRNALLVAGNKSENRLPQAAHTNSEKTCVNRTVNQVLCDRNFSEFGLSQLG